MDDWEMAEPLQSTVKEIRPGIETSNVYKVNEFAEMRNESL